MSATGTVKWFSQRRGYGFIIPANGGKDVFVHKKAVQDSGLSTLIEGQRVEYLLIADDKRNMGTNLVVVDGTACLKHRTESDQNGAGTGTVRWYSPFKGFGFIAPDAGGNDIFLHVSQLNEAGIDPVTTGDRLSYDGSTVRDISRSTVAKNLKRI